MPGPRSSGPSSSLARSSASSPAARPPHARAIVDTLSDAERGFVRRVARGYTPTDAAKLAGYSDPKSEAWRLLRHPKIVAAIRDECARVVDVDLTPLALGRLRRQLVDDTVPHHVAGAAAKTVLTAQGLLHKRHTAEQLRQDDAAATAKPLAKMTLAEMIAALRQALKPGAVIDAEAVDVGAVDDLPAEVSAAEALAKAD